MTSPPNSWPVGKVLALVLAACWMLAPAPAWADHTSGEPPPLRTFTTDQYQAGPPQTFTVPTRGGPVNVVIVRPVVPQGTKVPVILTYTPYGAGASRSFVARGYARAVADVVGTGRSGGCWDYGGAREQASAYDLVEWLGTREWSNHKVAMIGGSYDGTTANMAAAAAPPHLATIVPEVAISRWYGYAYHDGVRYFVADPRQRQGAVIDEQGFDTPAGFDFGFGLAGLGADPTEVCADDKLEHTLRGYSPQPDYDEFWLERDYVKDAGRVQVPVLVAGGWRDYNVKHSESTQWYEALGAHKMLVMGQQAHGLPDDALDFGTIVHAWFDRWLYEYETNVEHQQRYQTITNDGVLRRDWTWPPPGTSEVRLPLGAGASSFVDTGAATESHALATRGASGDLLWFESEPLGADTRIAGTPRLELVASSSATSTHYTPVLFDLGPPVGGGSPQCVFVPAQQACTITRGFLNARYRSGLSGGRDLSPGEPYSATVRFISNDWVVKASHRIGLALMSSNLWWAVPDAQRATNTVDMGASSLILPVVG